MDRSLDLEFPARRSGGPSRRLDREDAPTPTTRRPALLVASIAPASRALALLDDLGDPSRVEDLAGESGFPTIPDVDANGLGGRFGGHSVANDPVHGAFQTVASTFRDPTAGNGVSACLLSFGSGSLRIAISNLGPGILGGCQRVFLSPTAAAAIHGGAAFEIEPRFDVDARALQASLRVGRERFVTPVSTHPSFDTLDAIEDATFVTTSTNNDAPAASVGARLDRVEVPLPEPAPGPLLVGGVAFLLGMTRRRVRRRSLAA